MCMFNDSLSFSITTKKRLRAKEDTTQTPPHIYLSTRPLTKLINDTCLKPKILT